MKTQLSLKQQLTKSSDTWTESPSYRTESSSYRAEPPSYRLALLATLLAFVVVVLGAYTRLTDAGLGCPDWPGCYGQLIPTSPAAEMDTKKAWTEMTHRYAAGLLGMIIFALGILAVRNRHHPQQPMMLPFVLVALVVFQALLGMWTVTLKLLPWVVVAHLLGGLTTLSLVWRLTLQLKATALPTEPPNSKIDTLNIQTLNRLKMGTWIALAILGIQLFLGGWTSANYAALVCLEFPACQLGQFFPTIESEPFNLLSAFNLIEPLNHADRITIHMAHRIGAVITTLVIGWLSFQVYAYGCRRNDHRNLLLRSLSLIITILLTIQILLGITNVLAVLPLAIATAHNAIAALLLLALVTLNYSLQTSDRFRRDTQPHHDFTKRLFDPL